MYLECGYWNVDTEIKKRSTHQFFKCTHRLNPSKVELVFIKQNRLCGDKKLCEFIKKEKLYVEKESVDDKETKNKNRT